MWAVNLNPGVIAMPLGTGWRRQNADDNQHGCLGKLAPRAGFPKCGVPTPNGVARPFPEGRGMAAGVAGVATDLER